MSSTAILKASGLYTSPNNLSVPEGALSEAKNIIIKRDNIVEQRRGFKLFGTALPSAEDRVKQLTTYKKTLIRHFNETLQFENGIDSEDFQDFAGSFLEADAPLRMKFIESNGNLYFTSSNGIQKLSSKIAANIPDSVIVKAGAVKAIDIEAHTIYVPNLQTGFLPQDSAVAYRMLWAYNDANNNLIAGSPSQRELVYNRQIDLMLQDYMRFIGVLDTFTNTPLTTARINDKNYVSLLGLPASSSTADLRTNLIALAAKLDNDILLANQAATAPMTIVSASITTGICTVTVSGALATDYLVAGSNIFLAGFTGGTTGTINGAWVVVTVTGTTITFNVPTTGTNPVPPTGTFTVTSSTINSNDFRAIEQPPIPQTPAVHVDNTDVQSYMLAILDKLRVEPDAILSASDNALLDPIDITTSVNIVIDITIPQEVDSKYFYQIYRSAIFTAATNSSIEDVTPNDELQLVYEAYPTPAELISGEITITDITPDDFRGANLYTNNSTGEGILQANDAPPFATDINRYRNVVFYSNTRTKHNSLLNLLGVQNMINDYNNSIIPTITIATANGVNTYKFVTGQKESTNITTVADVANSLNGTYFLLDSASGNKFYVWFETTTAVDPMISGRIGIKVSLTIGDSANTVASKLKDRLSIQLEDFTVTVLANVVTVENFIFGEVTDPVDFGTGFTFTVTVQGRGEKVTNEISSLNAIAGNLFVSSGTADYFSISTALNFNSYYFWFKVGTVSDPAVVGKTGIPVVLTGSETADQVAAAISQAIPSDKFNVSVSTNVVTINNIQYGETTPISENVVNAGFTVTTLQTGVIQVLLSTNVSPAIAVDETARSLVHVINRNKGETIYAYYLSGAFDVPGKMFLEARDLSIASEFFIVANNNSTGASFNPNISPETSITSITTGANPVITTSDPHGMTNLDFVVIGNTNSQPPVDGVYEITYISPTSFSISKFVSVAGNRGAIIRASTSVTSQNDVKPNRIYYSKIHQPEAVPSVNFFDVGAQDKAILRIVPLRDSLFVFKEDGLYRISGDTSPFRLDLFDSSLIVTAPDSVSVCNNVIFSWTTQGIQSLTEGGATVISRNIDNIILRLGSVNYTNFKSVTFGVGYESDNSYLVWTVTDFNDEVSTQAFRFSTLTTTWTNYDKTNTCGVINPADDKMYLGAGDTNYIEQERKLFDRTDYADREISSAFSNNFLIKPFVYKLSSVTGLEIGDSLIQDQTITVFEFNTLLEKLDFDPQVSQTNFFSTLELKTGDNPRLRLLQLAQKLDLDPSIIANNFEALIDDYNGTITANAAGLSTIITSAGHNLITGRTILITGSNSSPSINGTYQVNVIDANHFSIAKAVKIPGTAGVWQTLGQNEEDLKACYNKVCSVLNNDAGVSFNNYRFIDNNTLQEAIIVDINTITRQVTLNLDIQYLVGDIKVYKAIDSAITYLPITMGDPLNLKHMSEATLMYENRNITGATISFASDLMPELIDIPFKLDGNGIFGHSNFGSGYFGGLSNSAPMRTFIPRQSQRCRFLILRVNHKTAREDYRLLGATVSGNVGLSTRAYR